MEYASSALRSVCRSARYAPHASVASPTVTVTFVKSGTVKRKPSFATRNTPAFTIVAECRNAETGVGASIAVGSHRWKGSCADFVNAASSTSSIAGTNSGLACRAATSMRERFVLPPATAIRAVPASSASPPAPVTTRALTAPSRDARRWCQYPISRKLVTDVSSQKAKSSTRFSESTRPSMDPANSSRYV